MRNFVVALAIMMAITSTALAKGGGSRPSYGGGHHSASHGGSYKGGSGSSHKGGNYKNTKTGDRYGKHK